MMQGRVVPSVTQQLAIGIGGGGWLARWEGWVGRGVVEGSVGVGEVGDVVERMRWEMVRRRRLRRLKRCMFAKGEEEFGLVWCG